MYIYQLAHIYYVLTLSLIREEPTYVNQKKKKDKTNLKKKQYENVDPNNEKKQSKRFNRSLTDRLNMDKSKIIKNMHFCIRDRPFNLKGWGGGGGWVLLWFLGITTFCQQILLKFFLSTTWAENIF